MSLWPAGREDQAKSDAALVGASPKKGGQAARRKAAPMGANCWLRESMCQIAWVEPAGDVDLGDLGAALFAEPALVALIALCLGGMFERVHGGLEQRPAQVGATVLGQWPAAILVA
jgi:hypothetical protein